MGRRVSPFERGLKESPIVCSRIRKEQQDIRKKRNRKVDQLKSLEVKECNVAQVIQKGAAEEERH